jgi:murein DD-endopeptidase MepM/ murein hydrolase activator NlpD
MRDAARPRVGRRVLAAAGGVALLAGLLELPYVDWRPVASPLAATPLVLRADAKGEGNFLAPRSGGRWHRGVDLAAPLQTPVRAVRSGRVVEAGEHQGLGRFVIVAHRGGVESVYGHLHDTVVREGQRVRQGDVLGSVGKTGNARHALILPHLHLEILRGGDPVDPQTLGLAIASADGTMPAPPGPVARSRGLADAGGE